VVQVADQLAAGGLDGSGERAGTENMSQSPI
jgi:hypothetical protein